MKNSREVQRRAEEKRKGTRGRNWELIVYPDDLPSDWIDKIGAWRVRTLISPLHDRDIKEDGTKKKNHHHVILMFRDGLKSVHQIREVAGNTFGVTSEGSIYGVAPIIPEESLIVDREGAIRYLTHIDYPEKAQYNKDEIIGLNGADLSELWKETKSESIKLKMDIEMLIQEHNILEYNDLLIYLRTHKGPDMWDKAASNTILFCNLLKSKRHSQPRYDYITGEEYVYSEDKTVGTVNPDTGEVIDRDKGK